MKKILIGLLFVALILTLGAIFVAGKMDAYIADVIRDEGTASLGAKVDVSDVKTNLKEGTAIINGFSVANPAGYASPHAIVIDSFSAQVDYDAQVVETVLIQNPVINAELIGIKSNFEVLLEEMPDSDEEEAVDESDPELTIRSLQLQQAKVNLSSDKLGQTSFIMDDFVMSDVSGTADEISEEVTDALLNHVSGQVKAFAGAKLSELVKVEAMRRAKDVVNEKLQDQLSDKVGDKLGGKLKGLKLKIK